MTMVLSYSPKAAMVMETVTAMVMETVTAMVMETAEQVQEARAAEAAVVALTVLVIPEQILVLHQTQLQNQHRSLHLNQHLKLPVLLRMMVSMAATSHHTSLHTFLRMSPDVPMTVIQVMETVTAMVMETGIVHTTVTLQPVPITVILHTTRSHSVHSQLLQRILRKEITQQSTGQPRMQRTVLSTTALVR